MVRFVKYQIHYCTYSKKWLYSEKERPTNSKTSKLRKPNFGPKNRQTDKVESLFLNRFGMDKNSVFVIYRESISEKYY